LADSRAGDPRERVLEVEPEPVREMNPADTKRVAEAFGDLADVKTPWTHGHSAGVANLARAAARSLRLDAQTADRLEVAALLEDLGRVAIRMRCGRSRAA
jgi:HD-GYP domain-containing protein (c-di-GMP phosphodiesterase class II)